MHNIINYVRINISVTEPDDMIMDVMAEFMCRPSGEVSDFYKPDCWHTLGIF